ncbi:MAG TPA: tail protein X [Fibrobacteria bacterium]|nr:tail protein X [Fibrobacteria bacterium]
MFLKNSRYYGIPTVSAEDASGRTVKAVKLRRLPAAEGDAHAVQGSDRLDLLAARHYGDATGFWRIADANGELQARDLLAPAGRIIRVPGK